jgi:large subunit ribosomal protein L23
MARKGDKVMIITPRVSEKTYAQAQNGTYVFNVPMTANKQQIAAAITEQYGVKVADVRPVIVKGKTVRAYRGKKQNPGVALRTKVKKVYVSLAEGESINLFNEEEAK